jgi:hypothetical protein
MCKTDFYDDPKEFLKTNVVEVDVDAVLPGFGESDHSVFHLILEEIPRSVAVTQTSRPVGKAYKLKRGRSDEPGIDAFFCPYHRNKTHFITISMMAQFVFTPEMSGCTFGIGSNANGTLIVGHSNRAEIATDWIQGRSMTLDPKATNPAPANVPLAMGVQAQAQHDVLQNSLAWKGKIIAPGHYMMNLSHKSTTFGVRKGMHWSFYTAVFMKMDNTYTLLGVTTQQKGV